MTQTPTPAQVWALVRAEVRRVNSAPAKPVTLPISRYTLMQEMAAQGHPFVPALFEYGRNLDRRYKFPPSPTDARVPHLRTDIATTARVVLRGWSNPAAVNRWVFERNIFWTATGAFHN